MKKFVLLLALGMTGCAGWGGFADTDRRFISLRYPPTGEIVSVAYIREHRYDRDALRQISKLCRDRHSGAVGDIDPKLIDFVALLRDYSGLPETVTFDVLSCYRDSATNARLARNDRLVARESWHTKGKAIDLRVPHYAGKAMAELAKTMQRGGVAYYPKTRHVHVDTGEVRSWAVR